MKELAVFLDKHMKVHESACAFLSLLVYFKFLCFSLEFPIKICIPEPDGHHHHIREAFMNRRLSRLHVFFQITVLTVEGSISGTVLVDCEQSFFS